MHSRCQHQHGALLHLQNNYHHIYYLRSKKVASIGHGHLRCNQLLFMTTTSTLSERFGHIPSPPPTADPTSPSESDDSTFALLPDDLWTKILTEYVEDAVDWTHFVSSCRHFLHCLPRPRPVQLVENEVRYPHVLFLEELNDEKVALLCHNSRSRDKESHLLEYLASKKKCFRIFTYCEGDKAYLEPSFYSSSFEQPVDRRAEGYGLVLHYATTAVKVAYGDAYELNKDCYWLIKQRTELADGYEICYGNEESSMCLDFDSFFKAFLPIEKPDWSGCRLEDYRADLPFYLTNAPAWQNQWRTRLYQAVPCQPRPFICHAYQTSVFAPGSWDDVDFAQDNVEDFILTGSRTAVVRFTMQIRDSHMEIKCPFQTFKLRMPLLQHDLEDFRSGDPGAWLKYLFERRSRRWFLARKYFRLAADVQETRRPVPVHDAVRDWQVLHPDYVYTVDQDGEFLLQLPDAQVARDVDTQEWIQQATQEGLSHQQVWCVVLHG